MSVSHLNPVRIIGGGFSGLTLGYYLIKQGVAVEIFEKSNRLGGLISTEHLSWGMVETAANGLLADARVTELFEDLQILNASHVEQKSESTKESRARYIFRSRPRRWPLNFVETLIFVVGCLRFFLSYKNMSKDKANGETSYETIESWATRYFGGAGFRYLIGPALQGIYGTTELSKTLVLRAFMEQCKNKNSRMGTPLHKPRQSYRGTIAPLNGMQELISGLAQKICDNGGLIHLETSGEIREGAFTVVATSAKSAALLFSGVDMSLAHELSTLNYLPLTSVTISVGADLGAELGAEASCLPGFGCLFPKGEKFNSLGVLFNSSIFANRGPTRSETWIFDCANKSEKELLAEIQMDRKRLLGVSDKILYSVTTVHPQALPHYNLALRNFLQYLEKRDSLPRHVYLSGNYLGGLGLAKILAYNECLAKKIKNEMFPGKL